MCAIQNENVYIKECLANGLVELMNNYPFDDITINEICYTAHVARATYYNYANGKHGKEDLLSFKVKRDYKEYIDKHGKQMGDDILNYIYENKTLFLLLQKNNLSNVIITFLKYANRNDSLQELSPYLSAYITFSYLGIVYQWVKDDFSIPPNEVSTVIYKAYEEIMKEFKKNNK